MADPTPKTWAEADMEERVDALRLTIKGLTADLHKTQTVLAAHLAWHEQEQQKIRIVRPHEN